MSLHLRPVQVASSLSVYDEGSRMTSPSSRQNFRSLNPVLEPCVISLGQFLRQRHPRDTAAYVEAETGVSAGTVEKWLAGIAFPRAAHQFRLIGAYGPSVFKAMMPSAPDWLNEAVRVERLRELEETQARLARDIETLRGG